MPPPEGPPLQDAPRHPPPLWEMGGDMGTPGGAPAWCGFCGESWWVGAVRPRGHGSFKVVHPEVEGGWYFGEDAHRPRLLHSPQLYVCGCQAAPVAHEPPGECAGQPTGSQKSFLCGGASAVS